jgi:hypothetical protein
MAQLAEMKMIKRAGNQARSVSQVVESLLSKHEDLSSKPSPKKRVENCICLIYNCS